MSEPLTAREFLSLVDPSRQFIPELHVDDCDDVACVRCVKPASSTSAMDVPLPVVVAEVKALAEAARRKRQARAERVERKRVEHLRGHMPVDDPDRHDIDVVDGYFARLASTFQAPATDQPTGDAR
ncbi:hypothetical protein [Streptomyces sp. NPDC059828]|uniref:hypothetical protein n=1 Tax=Streptomyces sp. NPDC059828 TaxID=3346965 RepID=UPI003656403A